MKNKKPIYKHLETYNYVETPGTLYRYYLPEFSNPSVFSPPALKNPQNIQIYYNTTIIV